MPTTRQIDIHGLPVVVSEPDDGVPSRLILWLSHLGGSKDRPLPQLESLAARGARAVSFDPPGHGDRATSGDPRVYANTVLERFRLLMWPILGQMTLESLRVIDATRDEGITSVRAGGISMGGDVAIALAGIDPRIDRVAAVGSTADWTRPGMTRLDDPAELLQQGSPDSYGAWLRQQLDPMLHLARYRPGTMMRLHCGGDDHHVPRTGAQAFAEAVAGGWIEVVIDPGLDHFGVCSDEGVVGDCLAYLGAD